MAKHGESFSVSCASILISYALSLKYVELTHSFSKCGERLCFVTPVLLKYFVSNILAKIIFTVSVMD
jgi:hypothetical protein